MRLVGISFGLPQIIHPDEPHIVEPTKQFFTGDWNPHSFLYPSLSMYTIHAVQRAVFSLGLAEREHSTYYLIGRITVAVMGVLTVLLVALWVRRLAGETVALVGALWLALNPLHVIHSHYATTDVPLSLLVLISLWVAWRLMEIRQRVALWYILAGLAWGLTTSMKVPGLFVGAAMIVAHWLRVNRGARIRPPRRRDILQGAALGLGLAVVLAALGGALVAKLFDLARVLGAEYLLQFRQPILQHLSSTVILYAVVAGIATAVVWIFRREVFRDFRYLVLLGIAALVGFVLTTPYSVLDARAFFRDFLNQSFLSKTTWGGMFAGAGPGWVFLMRSLARELGVGVFLLFVWTFVRLVRRRASLDVVLWTFLLAYWAFIGSWKILFARYLLPMVPVAVLLATTTLRDLWEAASTRSPWRRVAVPVLAMFVAVTFVPDVRGVLSFDRYLLRKNTRELAFDWARRNLDRSLRILEEQYTVQLELAGYNVINIHYDFADSVDAAYLKRHRIDVVVVGSKLANRTLRNQGQVLPRGPKYARLAEYGDLIHVEQPGPGKPGPTIWFYRIDPTKLDSILAKEHLPRNDSKRPAASEKPGGSSGR